MSKEMTTRERHEAGEKARREVLGSAYADSGHKTDPFYKNFYEFTVDHCWGNVWIRPGLDRKTRSMLNIAMLTAMARWHELGVHIKGAINNGVSEEEIAEILLQAGVYAGAPVAAEGFRTAFKIIEEARKAK